MRIRHRSPATLPHPDPTTRHRGSSGARRAALAAAALLGALPACHRTDAPPDLVLYSSIDEDYARNACALFKKRSGIQVRLVSDTEAAKSTGLVNRLIAEKQRPEADVFWSGDLMRARQLKELGLLQDGAGVTGAAPPKMSGGLPVAAARLRVIIYHKNHFRGDTRPPSRFADLASPGVAPQACLANPLFGTTSMHAAALRQKWGEERARAFFNDFAKNGGRMLSSNGEIRRRVAEGEFACGLTDSDDVSVALLDGKPVGFVIPDQEANGDGAVLVPSTAVVIRGAPHPEGARLLADFLLSADMERELATGSGAHFPMRDDLPPPPAFGIRLRDIRVMSFDDIEAARHAAAWQDGFLREWAERQSR